MRQPPLILLFFMLLVCAVTKAQRITLSEKNAALVTVFDKISDQTGFGFMATSGVFKIALPVTIQIWNADLNTVLLRLLENQPITFRITNKIVVISVKQQLPQGKPEAEVKVPELSGLVVNEFGEPMKGANISLSAEKGHYTTNNEGRFVLTRLPRTGKLITSYVGYQIDSLQLNGQQSVTIRLKPATAALTEVNIVNTGYQQLDKQRASGSFGKPDMTIFNNRTSTPDIAARLEGLVAGLVVSTANGDDSGSAITNTGTRRSLVRGLSTVNLNFDPLYVVNGLQISDLSTINPDDIADITVLKDAAAAAIWGVKAANGVFVITTKRGRPNSALRISYSGYLNIQGKPNYDNSHFLNSSQYITAAKEIFDPVVYPLSSLDRVALAPHEQLLYDQFAHASDPSYVAAKNYQLDSLSRINNQNQILGLWYQNAVTMNHTLAASAGTARYNFYSSVSYADNQTVDKEPENHAYRININQSYRPSKILTVSLNTFINNTRKSRDNDISVNSSFIPYQLFQDNKGQRLNLNYLKGLSTSMLADYEARGRINLNYNPLDELREGFTKSNALTVNLTGNVNLKLFKGLSVDGTYGYQQVKGSLDIYQDISTYDSRIELVSFTRADTPNEIPVYYLPVTGGRYAVNDFDKHNWTVRNQLVYEASPGAGRDVFRIQLGQEVLEEQGKRTTTVVRGYDLASGTSPILDYTALTQGISGTVTGSGNLFDSPFMFVKELARNVSYFSLFNYTFNRKYSFDASLRQDKSNLFSSDESSHPKPIYSLGGKWQVKKEGFMESFHWINDLGLRATYGITGNAPSAGTASSFDIVSEQTDPVTGKSLVVINPANRNLRFEQARTINLGLDYALFSNRITGSIDFYTKKTTDLVGAVTLNAVTGTTASIGNLGVLNNKGIEIGLYGAVIQHADFKWSTRIIVSHNYNRLKSYTDFSPYQLTDTYRLYSNVVPGYASGAVFAYRYAGLDKMGDPQISLANGTVTKKRDAATANDLVYMGSTIPKFSGGLSNTFRYQQFSLSLNMISNLGHVFRRPANDFYTGRLTEQSFSGNLSVEFAQRWKKPGDEAITRIPSYVADASISFIRRNTDYYNMADINVVSASYVKLRDATLTYNLNPALLKIIGVRGGSLFLQSGNYMIWRANHDHIDPDNTLNYANGVTGKSYGFGANITF